MRFCNADVELGASMTVLQNEMYSGHTFSDKTQLYTEDRLEGVKIIQSNTEERNPCTTVNFIGAPVRKCCVSWPSVIEMGFKHRQHTLLNNNNGV